MTGDGTSISRSVHLVVFVFTLVDSDIANPNSPKGNCALALIQTTEDYDNPSEALKDIIDEVTNLRSITVDDVVYDRVFFRGRYEIFSSLYWH